MQVPSEVEAGILNAVRRQTGRHKKKRKEYMRHEINVFFNRCPDKFPNPPQKRNSPYGLGPPPLRVLMFILRHTTVGRAPPDEGSARR